MAKLVGIYLSASVVRRDPGYLDALQAGIGLNQVILSGTVRLSTETLRLNPFGSGHPEAQLTELTAQLLDGSRLIDERECAGARAGRGPGLSYGDDDTALREAIALCRQRGLAVWLVVSAWTGQRWMLCPSKAAVNDWLGAAFGDVARSYDADCVDVTHARYPKLSVPQGVEMCTCADCARAARDLGYDLPRIVDHLRRLPACIGRLDGATLAALAGQRMSLPEVVELLGSGPSLQDWLNLRADIVATQAARLRATVREAAGRPVLFGCDTYPPALAMLVGHRYAGWASHSDWTSPLLSHVDAFITRAFAEWTRRLREVVSGLDETSALRLLYRLTGYDDLDMPATLADLGVGERDGEYRRVPLVALMERDLLKARLHAPRQIPCYPIIQGGNWPTDAVRRLVAYADSAGHDGIIFQGSDSLVDYLPAGAS